MLPLVGKLLLRLTGSVPRSCVPAVAVVIGLVTEVLAVFVQGAGAARTLPIRLDDATSFGGDAAQQLTTCWEARLQCRRSGVLCWTRAASKKGEIFCSHTRAEGCTAGSWRSSLTGCSAVSSPRAQPSTSRVYGTSWA